MSKPLMKHLLIITTIAACGGWIAVARLLTKVAAAREEESMHPLALFDSLIDRTQMRRDWWEEHQRWWEAHGGGTPSDVTNAAVSDFRYACDMLITLRRQVEHGADAETVLCNRLRVEIAQRHTGPHRFAATVLRGALRAIRPPSLSYARRVARGRETT
jgi:hypothetical protein